MNHLPPPPQTQPTKLQTAFSNHIVAVGGIAVILQCNVCVTSNETNSNYALF